MAGGVSLGRAAPREAPAPQGPGASETGHRGSGSMPSLAIEGSGNKNRALLTFSLVFYWHCSDSLLARALRNFRSARPANSVKQR